jgi:hypothetical protein
MFQQVTYQKRKSITGHVRPGFNMGDKSEFFEDLKAGDSLVLNGNEELKPGMNVSVKL